MAGNGIIPIPEVPESAIYPGTKKITTNIISMTWKSGIEPFIIMDLLKILIIINVLELGKKRK